MTGNAGKNMLDGYIGADTMAGYGGDDRYYLDNAGDIVIERPARDTTRSSSGGATYFTVAVNFSAYTLADNVERLARPMAAIATA